MTERLNKLVDVDIDEISLVDKAANRRAFILLKRHYEEMSGMTEVEKREPTPADIAWKKVLEIVEVEMQRLTSVKDFSETREQTFSRMINTPEGKRLYSAWLNASDEVVKGLTNAEYEVFAKSGFRTFRDLIDDRMESLAKVAKEQNPKLTKWEARDSVLKTEVGSNLYNLYIAEESRLPPGVAITKLLKLYKVPATELLRNVF